jgi:hypothetical protein
VRRSNDRRDAGEEEAKEARKKIGRWEKRRGRKGDRHEDRQLRMEGEGW